MNQIKILVMRFVHEYTFFSLHTFIPFLSAYWMTSSNSKLRNTSTIIKSF